jgi:cytochrome c oxidase cbb3-type subunit 3
VQLEVSVTLKAILLAAGTVLLCSAMVEPKSAAQGQRGRGGQGNRDRGQETFPAQQRPPGDSALIDRGKALFGVHCSGCHGPDLRGDEGPNLLRSQLVLNDQHGELLRPVIFGERSNAGMPAVNIPEADVTALAEFIHSVAAAGGRQGRPPSGPPVVLNILKGNAAAGQAYFTARCTGCHSTAGDLEGIASRVSDPKTLQNLWVSGGGGGGRGGGGGGRGAVPNPKAKPVTVTVTIPTGEKVDGTLARIDEFNVTLVRNGTERTFRRDGDVPKVEVHDPLEAHRKLLPIYSDKDIHDVTAYLVTLK